MDSLHLLGSLGPIMALIMSGLFFLFWSRQKEKKHVLHMCMAYLLCACGVVVSLFMLPGYTFANVLASTLLYSTGLYLLARSACKRVNLRVAVLPFVLVAVIGLSAGAYFCYTDESLTPRLHAMNGMIATHFLLASYSLRKAMKTDSSSRLLAGVFCNNAAIAFVMPLVIFYFEGPVLAVDFRDSLHWLLMNFAFAVLSIVTGFCLMSAIVADLIADMKRISSTDLLTGIKNRAAFDEEMRNMFQLLDRTPLPLSMVVIDIDFFKSINDRFGHQSGDAVLRAFGSILRESSRRSDLVGRIGGEEFCLLLWNTNDAGARLVAENLRTQFENLQLDGLPEDERVTFSAGIAALMPGEDCDDLYRRADIALYEAKQNGRNQVCLNKRAVAENGFPQKKPRQMTLNTAKA